MGVLGQRVVVEVNRLPEMLRNYAAASVDGEPVLEIDRHLIAAADELAELRSVGDQIANLLCMDWPRPWQLVYRWHHRHALQAAGRLWKDLRNARR